MMDMQKELWEKYKDKWSPLEPEYARNSILWMIGELGEVLQIIKKRGESDIINDPNLKAHFLEELVDVYMYFNDIILRYGFTPEQISDAYITKYNKNMKRDFVNEHNNYLKEK